MPWKYLMLLGNSIINTGQQREIAEMTNKNNRELVEMQNKAASLEAEKAYNRSKATNQVNLMQQAGMSRAGAINALNGGGSYTPAPVNTSQDIAPQVNFDALSNVAQMAMQEKMQDQQLAAAKEQQKVQLAADKEQHKAQLESNERIAQLQADTTNRNADNRLNFDKETFEKLSPYQIAQIQANIDKVKEETKATQVQTKDLEYRYGEYVANRSIRNAIGLFEEAQAVYNVHVHEKDLNTFIRNNMWYNHETGDYEYIKHDDFATKSESLFTQFWDFVASVLPAEQVARLLRIIFVK